MEFDCACEATIVTTIEADSEEQAMEKWQKFKDEINVSDHMMTKRATCFYAHIDGLEIPSIEEVQE